MPDLIYRAKCGRDIPVGAEGDGSYRLQGLCPVTGAASGQPLIILTRLCEHCIEPTQYAVQDQGVREVVNVSGDSTGNLPAIVQQPTASAIAAPVEQFVPLMPMPMPMPTTVQPQENPVGVLPPEPAATNLADVLAQQQQQQQLSQQSQQSQQSQNTQLQQPEAQAPQDLLESLLQEGTLELPGLPPPAPPAEQQSPQPPPESDLQPVTQQVLPQQQNESVVPATPPVQESGTGTVDLNLVVPVQGSETADVLSLVMDQLTPEDKLDVDEVLSKAIPELSGGPSVGGFSWHTLDLPMSCWRKAYYSLVRGLVPTKSKRAFQWGSLYHACWELWFKTGGRLSWDLPCEVIQKAGGARLAAEVRACVLKEMQIYSAMEAQEWDIRAVENNAVFWLDPVRIKGKLVRIPISCRHDLIYAKRPAGAACAPAGPVPSGVYVLDRKTAAAATRDLIYGYAMDPQFMTNALVFKKSGEEEQFGPLLGVQVALAIKHKTPSEKSFHRIEGTVDLNSIEEFHYTELAPCAAALYEKLFSDDREDISKWPRKHNQCAGKYLCNYFDLCVDGGGGTAEEIYYKVDPTRIFTIERLASPPKEKVGSKAAVDNTTVNPIKETKKAKKKELQTALSDVLLCGIAAMSQFAKANFLVPGHTEKSVKTAIMSLFASLWKIGDTWDLQVNVGNTQPLTYKCTVKGNGVGWHTIMDIGEKTAKGALKNTSFRSVVTWKSLTDGICADWWDIAKHGPIGQQY